MKQLIFSFGLLIILTACKNDKQEQPSETKIEPITVSEKIANANGFQNWNKVTEIKFTFNVDSGEKHSERSWSWKPKTAEVTMMTAKDTVQYIQTSIDSLALNADKAFINDKYWLLAPFQLMWDKGTKTSEPTKTKAPISNEVLNKITLTYGDTGGYTPGDAYDFYYDDNFMMKEWAYRHQNAAEPSMVTTWEDYEDFNGIKISKTHKQPNSDFKLYFTNVEVKM